MITRNGGSVKCTKHSVVGCNNTLDLKGTPWKPSSRKGMSISNRPSLYDTYPIMFRNRYMTIHFLGAWITYCVCYFLRECFKFLVQCGSASSFLLFGLQFVLVTIYLSSPFVASLVELYIRCFAIKLNILWKSNLLAIASEVLEHQYCTIP